VRVAIAYPSSVLRDVLARAVRGQHGWSVAWTAADADQALAHCAADPPDVLLIALQADGRETVAAISQVVRTSPCTVLAVAGAQAPPGLIMDAIGAGATDAVPAPAVAPDGSLSGVDEVVRKLRAVAKINRVPAARGPAPARQRHDSASPGAPLLVAVGASTGGPAALATVLGGLPPNLAAAVVVVQHVDERFAGSLASWLKGQVTLPVHVAEEGAAPARGEVMLAGTNEDMVVGRDLALHYRAPGDGSFYHPSVNAFFGSIASTWPSRGIAVLLTGIGRDGAEGLLALRQHGWHTIAQDEATSVVYGMPRAARDVGAAVEILPLGDIAPAIVRWVARATGGRPGSQSD
jgi:two-component system response regulator WspF